MELKLKTHRSNVKERTNSEPKFQKSTKNKQSEENPKLESYLPVNGMEETYKVIISGAKASTNI